MATAGILLSIGMFLLVILSFVSSESVFSIGWWLYFIVGLACFCFGGYLALILFEDNINDD